MNDRLGDLEIPAWALEDDEADNMESGRGGYDDMNGNGAEQEQLVQPKYMVTFFNDVETIKSDIEGIKEATRLVGEINDEAVMATTTDAENECSAKLKPLVNLSNKKAKRAKNMLALIKEDTAKLEEEEEGVKASDIR